MYPRELTFEAFADLVDESTITSRTDQGFMQMTTTGIHPELGAWTVIQALPGLTIVSHWEPHHPEGELTSDEVAWALSYLRTLTHKAGGIAITVPGATPVR